MFKQKLIISISIASVSHVVIDTKQNYHVSENRKLAPKEYKSKNDWVEDVNLLELCKKLKFDHDLKCYLLKAESTLENDTYKFLRYFEVQKDPLIPTRRQNLAISKLN